MNDNMENNSGAGYEGRAGYEGGVGYVGELLVFVYSLPT